MASRMSTSEPIPALIIRAAGISKRRLDELIPPVLRPLIRAYVLAYVSVVAPRLLSVLAQRMSLTRRQKSKTSQDGPNENEHPPRRPRETLVRQVHRILRAGLDWQRFPAFCAVLVGGSTLLEAPSKILFDRWAKSLSAAARQRFSRWCSSFVAAWLAIAMLQSKHSSVSTEQAAVKGHASGAKNETVRLAGRTLDLTLFAAARALDAVIGALWMRQKSRRVDAGTWTGVETVVGRLADPAVFAFSCCVIMWTWIYTPKRLPPAYDKWIGAAAAVDPRLLEALRRARSGEIQYAKDTGQAGLLGAMCRDYGYPEHWGDPKTAIPFRCDLVHMGQGPSCEWHAVWRFGSSFKWAMATYLPLNLLLVLRSLLKQNEKGGPQARVRRIEAFRNAIVGALRSSAFLGAFIALFYYGVCLARTRLGPRLLGYGARAYQRIDSGYCVGSGCAACGWSVLLEKASRRGDLALFVAPRAAAALLPRRYDPRHQWKESAVFAASAAVVFATAMENPRRIRGVMGSLLGTVLRQ